MRRLLWGSRRRRLSFAIALLVLAVTVVAASAWTMSPAPAALTSRVDAHLEGANGTPVPLTAIAPILREAVVATEDERFYRHHGVDLNSAYFGEDAYGARAASEHYFSIPPRRLGVAEASLLAGLIQAPSAYDPLLHPQLARARQADVL